MDKHDKLLVQILQGRSDTNIGFKDLCALLHHLGFEERIRGSHHIYRRKDVEERLNLQKMAAKPNHIRFVRYVQ